MGRRKTGTLTFTFRPGHGDPETFDDVLESEVDGVSEAVESEYDTISFETLHGICTVNLEGVRSVTFKRNK